MEDTLIISWRKKIKEETNIGEVFMKEIRINQIENGYTIYSDCKTKFVENKEKVIETIKKIL